MTLADHRAEPIVADRLDIFDRIAILCPLQYTALHLILPFDQQFTLERQLFVHFSLRFQGAFVRLVRPGLRHLYYHRFQFEVQPSYPCHLSSYFGLPHLSYQQVPPFQFLSLTVEVFPLLLTDRMGFCYYFVVVKIHFQVQSRQTLP